MADSVRITDVAPRDGLQNEPGVIPTEEKVELIRLLCETGVDEVEVTSFVSPKWVPQLGDAAEVLRTIAQDRDISLGLAEVRNLSQPTWKQSSPMLSALIPNERGFDGLMISAQWQGSLLIEKISLFTAASESFSRRNTNASIAESIQRFRPVVERARSYRLRIRGYISCIVACPFEGSIAPQAVVEVSKQLIDAGIDELDLGDTIGAGTPETISTVLREVSNVHPLTDPETFTLHLHDTYGRAADCVKAALDLGVRSFDGSVAGLGGCPYASTPGRRAPGNISTQTLVRTIHDAGYRTHVDLDRLEEAGRFAMKIVTASRQRAAAAAADAPESQA